MAQERSRIKKYKLNTKFRFHQKREQLARFEAEPGSQLTVIINLSANQSSKRLKEKMNSSTQNSSSITPPTDCRIWKEKYRHEDYIFTSSSIILNILTCPMIVFINSLVIVAVIKKRRLQTMYNMLLACLAATDLVVGVAVQPSFILGEISIITGSIAADYCRLFRQTVFAFLYPSLTSLILLALLSIERFVAIKYSLRYFEIVTKFRLIVAVIFCYITGALPAALRLILPLSRLNSSMTIAIACVSLLVIIHCQIFVYLVSRRHRKQIQAVQVSQDAKRKFLEETKAVKTTSIIIGFVLFSYFPSLLLQFIKRYYFSHVLVSCVPLILSCILVNSLCNPIIYCWRSSVLRKALVELLRRNNNTG